MDQTDARIDFRRALAAYFDQTVLLSVGEGGTPYSSQTEGSAPPPVDEIASDLEVYVRFRCEFEEPNWEEEVEIV